jgi:hypothetical protein
MSSNTSGTVTPSPAFFDRATTVGEVKPSLHAASASPAAIVARRRSMMSSLLRGAIEVIAGYTLEAMPQQQLG